MGLALAVAAHEIEQHNFQTVMILLPDDSWAEHTSINGPACIYVRYSNIHSGLKALPIDLLILASEPDSDWNDKGIQLAYDRLRAQKGSCVIDLAKGLIIH